MRNTILGAILAIWGAAILIVKLTGGQSNHGGAYGTGQTAALVFAVVLIVAGIRAILSGQQKRRG